MNDHNHQLLKWHCRPEIERPLRYARRLAVMGPQEITTRLRDQIAVRRPIEMPPWTIPGQQLLRDSLERRFLFGPCRAREICKTLPPGNVERWEVFGVPVTLEPGKIDWQAGDLRWTWELNRHQFLFTFARAFLVTGDAVYGRRITALVEDWLAKNPVGEGVNWSSALEVAMRALSWLWTLPLVLDLDEDFLRRWLWALYEHYQYLNGNLSLFTDPTNHLIGETAVLWILSVALPDLPDGPRQERYALEILAREIERQVTPDGVSAEQSTGYQRFVLDFCLQVLAVGGRSGRAIPPIIKQRTAAMLDFLAALDSAEFGDSDGARGVPFCEPSPDVTPWLGRADALPPPPAQSRVFPGGGYCLSAAEHEGRRMALLFDAGPLGLWPNASHGHADALSIQVKLDDRWLLGDPGTGCYLTCPSVRDLLRGTAAHNTVTVDGLDHTDALDTFRWLKPVPARFLETYSDSRVDYMSAAHEGYQRLRQPVMHHRSVLFIRPPAPDAGWLLTDLLDGAGRHHCSLRFHFPPGTKFRDEDALTILAIEPGARAGLRFQFPEPGFNAEATLWSPRFGQWEPAPVLTLHRMADLPLVWHTRLTPVWL